MSPYWPTVHLLETCLESPNLLSSLVHSLDGFHNVAETYYRSHNINQHFSRMAMNLSVAQEK